MASSKQLSTDEVEALIDGLSDTSESMSIDNGFSGQEIRPFTLGSDDLSVLGDYYALRMINERFCRLARSVFLPMLRVQPRISSFPPEVKTFDEYSQNVETFVSLNTSRMEELKGNSLLVIPPDFISLLTNSYYGGSVVRSLRRAAGEFTATEQRVIEIISEGLDDAMTLAWKDLTSVTFNVIGREENIQFASFVDGNDPVIICSFLVQLPSSEPASFDVVYPLQVLKPIASQLRSRLQSESGDDDLTWKQRLEKAILDIPLLVTAELERPKTTLGRIVRIKPNDVFHLTKSEQIKVLVEGKEMFMSDLGQSGQNVAVELTQRLSPKS
ncbi:MAG: flagellar motor switch protein FliM [Paracoccaceae bacterium]